MRIFAATSPHDASMRAAAPTEILRWLAFGRPQRQLIRTSVPVPASAPSPAASAEAPALGEESFDLAQRVRLSGEW
jgi:hypothetical protein